jgi:hypothetical protein
VIFIVSGFPRLVTCAAVIIISALRMEALFSLQEFESVST